MGTLKAAVLGGGRVPRSSGPHPYLGGDLFISVHAVEWVLEQSQAKGISLNVLFVIACHCDPEGYAWPSFDRICKLAHTSRPSVSRALEELEASGEIQVDHSPGRTTNRYFLAGFAATVKDSKENAPQQLTNGKETVKPVSVSSSKETELAPLIREEENKGIKEEPRSFPKPERGTAKRERKERNLEESRSTGRREFEKKEAPKRPESWQLFASEFQKITDKIPVSNPDMWELWKGFLRETGWSDKEFKLRLSRWAEMKDGGFSKWSAKDFLEGEWKLADNEGDSDGEYPVLKGEGI
jgi:hypothetical protein